MMSCYTTVKFLLGVNRSLCLKVCLPYFARVQYSLSVRSVCSSPHLAAGHKFIDIKENIFKRTWRAIKFHTLEKTKLKMAGYYLYETIADKINYIVFFKEMDLPDTFNSWFLVTELHVWMLMAKAMEMGSNGRLMRNFIVEAMWGDVSAKGKKLGAEHMAVASGQVLQLGDQFQAALLTYDEGLLSDDKVLASALWRRFFGMNCDDPEKLETMVNYVRQQMHYLDNLSEEDFKKRNINWSPLQVIRTVKEKS